MHIERRLVIEELANTITHGIGLILSIVALFILARLAWQKNSLGHFYGCAIYGSTQVILYAASTIYHAVRTPRLKHLFLQIDRPRRDHHPLLVPLRPQRRTTTRR